MMALATYQLQGSRSTLPIRLSSRSEGGNLKHFVPTFHAFGRKESFISLKCRSCSSVRASHVRGPNPKIFKISAFKGNSRHDDSEGTTNGSTSLRNAVKVSYLQQKSEESSVECSVVPAPYTADETTTRTRAIQNLFKHWLFLLRTPPQTEPLDEVLEEPSSAETPEVPKTVQKEEKSAILKSVWCYFLGLDATVKIPLLIFAPLYLAINLAYGSEVSKELTPLWIIGPLVAALYVKMFRSICGLYVFSFKQSVNIIKNIPSYYLLVCEYLFKGKLKEVISNYIQQQVDSIRNINYREALKGKAKDIQGWLVEKYLDYVESIWPYYCRMIRFLKRANLI